MTRLEPLDVFHRLWTHNEIVRDKAPAQRMGQVPTIFQTRAQRSELPAHGGPLSIKMVRTGSSSYRFGRRSYNVTPGHVLVVAPGDQYATVIGDQADIVTLYLPSALLVDTLQATGEINRPSLNMKAPDFAAHLRADKQGLRPAIERLVITRDAELHQERLIHVVAAVADLIRDATGATDRIPAAKPATRQELFRRASLARHYIEDAPQKPATLQELASHAALSPFHLLRSFMAAFGETPMQMRRRLCLERAEAMLAARRLPISEIAVLTGFESPSAFSRAFNRHTGLTPSAFRDAA